MKLMSFINARLQEASTYAGLSALCVALSSALSQSGTARTIALFGAIASGVGAMAKSENNVGLAEAMDEAEALVPVLTKTVTSLETAPPGHLHTASRTD